MLVRDHDGGGGLHGALEARVGLVVVLAQLAVDGLEDLAIVGGVDDDRLVGVAHLVGGVDRGVVAEEAIVRDHERARQRAVGDVLDADLARQGRRIAGRLRAQGVEVDAEGVAPRRRRDDEQHHVGRREEHQGDQQAASPLRSARRG